MPKHNKQRRYDARKKQEKEGISSSPDLEKKNVERKRSPDITKLERWGKNYHLRRMNKLGLLGVISTSIPTPTPTMSLRPKQNQLLKQACDMFKSWSITLRESCTSVRKLSKAMTDVKSEVGKYFQWLTYLEKPNHFGLAFVTTVSGREIYHPWVEVKKSEIIEESKEEKCYGLFAARDFPANTEIGLYTGSVETIRKGVQLSEFKLCYREKYLIDIVDQTEKRLKYQTGAHMVNDKDWEGKGCNDTTNNNAMINDHLILYSTRYIKKGEEITVSYNLDK